MPDALTLIKNRTDPRLGQLERSLAAEESARPAWVIAILASVLIFTTVVDVLGNLLVIISVFRNRKLRNSGKTVLCPLWDDAKAKKVITRQWGGRHFNVG